MNWRLGLGALALLLGLAGCDGGAADAPGSDAVPTCAEGDTLCGLSCVEIGSDPRHCGACGVACAAGESCAAGACAATCPDGLEACAGGCHDLDASQAHCGACGNACGAGERCSEGACVLVCPAGQVACDGACRTLATSDDHCGACGNACGSGEICVDGACAAACGDELLACAGACVDPASDRAHCGGCDAACAGDEACVDGACVRLCAGGLTDCGEGCRDTASDRTNCGACGEVCDAGEDCIGGACTLGCSGFASTLCGDACTNTAFDPANCGGCGNACPAGQVCSEGACAETCGAGADVCGGGCTSLAHDPANCGACGATCLPAPNAATACSDGTCGHACLAGWADCNGDLGTAGGDGCETSLGANPDHCGACGVVCPAPINGVAGCTDGACTMLQCDLGFADCNGGAADGCETDVAADSLNCGMCGIACGATRYCSDSSCRDLAGEDCASPILLGAGTNVVVWDAKRNDYLPGSPSCMPGAVSGPDVVFRYAPSFTGTVDLSFDKPANNRWGAVVSDEACGSNAVPVACISEQTPATMGGSFPVTAGTTYHVYLIDGLAGSAPLDNPLRVHLTEYDCSINPPAAVQAVAPAAGATASDILPMLEVVFDAPVAGDAGTITLTGSVGTSRTIVLPSPAVTFSADGRTMTIDPQTPFREAESIAVSWTGLADQRCGKAVAPPAWSFQVPLSFCPPSTIGLSGAPPTRVDSGIVGSISEFYMAVDQSPGGYVYLGGSTTLHRRPKAGGPTTAVHDLAGLTGAHLGFAMVIDGPAIYTVESKTSGTTGHLFRISSDGGATWNVQDMATFSPAPADDFRGAAARGGRIYLITSEGTASVPTQIWSVDANASSLPAPATLEASFGGYTLCSGLAVDAQAWYSSCRLGTGPLYQVIRIDRATAAVQVLAPDVPGNINAASIHAHDVNGDGRADVLYRNENVEELHAICSPAVDPRLHRLLGWGGTNGNYGLAFDEAAGELWAFDDDTLEFLRLR